MATKGAFIALLFFRVQMLKLTRKSSPLHMKNKKHELHNLIGLGVILVLSGMLLGILLAEVADEQQHFDIGNLEVIEE
jgi:hypothetical protein